MAKKKETPKGAENGSPMKPTDAAVKVQELVDSLAAPMSKASYKEFLEELMANAEGWKMTLDEEFKDEEE